VLTHGGPANATHLFATYAFDIGMSAGVLGMGAAVALAMLPALAMLMRGAHAVSEAGIVAHAALSDDRRARTRPDGTSDGRRAASSGDAS